MLMFPTTKMFNAFTSLMLMLGMFHMAESHSALTLKETEVVVANQALEVQANKEKYAKTVASFEPTEEQKKVLEEISLYAD